MLEEADDGRALLHCAEVVGELDVRASGRARARDEGRRTETDGAQADDNGFQNVPPRGGQVHGARRSRAPQASARRCRSCLFRSSEPSRRGTGVASVAYETFKRPARSLSCAATARRPVRGVSEAAGQGLEPQLPEPESGVLPLDDPAGLGRIVPGSVARLRSRGGTRGRGASRRRCRCARSPRRGARAPSLGASP